ncbi:MAG: folylpolyglutamate synthase/dihydrofolate synthase family protein [Pyrinomonadaceae bacterium]
MDFESAVRYLLSLGNEVETMKLGLESVRRLLSELGEPQKKYLKVQVAGTNGKGSVCAFLDSICREAGIKVGLYTSPHLISITERIKITGVEISEGDFARLATRVREASETLVAAGDVENLPTFFEQVTAIALLAFVESGVELAILETGLGGRLDATTAADAEIAAITRIDLDHQEYLGDTIEEIAAEKAAIIREGASVVVGRQEDAALRVILERCAEVGVTPSCEIYGPWQVTPAGANTNRVDTTRFVYPNVVLGLKGRHQAENAETALNVCQTLGYEFGFEFGDSNAVVSGLENASHPGRLEYIGRFLLDGAHNIGGAKALRHYLDYEEERPITMIFGAMRDKDVAEIAKILWPRAERLILTHPSNSRTFAAEDLRQFLPNEVDPAKVHITQNVADAVRMAEELTPPDSIILATGSLYLVGEVRKIALSR